MSRTKEAFQFYYDYVKPLYCEIEARDNTLPVELLFEIHAAFDHLRRFYVNDEDENISTGKAISHLKRGTLDAFKLKLKYFHDDVEHLLNGDVDLSLVDSGKFLPNLLRDKAEIIRLATTARQQESQDDPTDAFNTWQETSEKINVFFDTYLMDTGKIDWARKQTFKWFRKECIVSFLIGVASSALVSWLFLD